MKQIQRWAWCGSMGTLAVLATLASALPAGAAAEWGPLGTGLSGTTAYPHVKYLHVWDGKLVAAGEFSSADGSPAHNIAIWNGTQWAPLADGWDSVRGLATYNGQLAVAGERPDSLDAEIATWDGTTWTTVVKSDYFHLASSNENLYQSDWGVGASSTWSAAYEYDGVAWSMIGGWSESNIWGRSSVNVIAAIDGALFVDVGPWGEIYSYDGISWISHGVTGVEHGRGLVNVSNQLHAGGSNSLGWPIISRWDGAVWERVYSSECGTPKALAEYNGELIVAGSFSTACNPPSIGVASWNGVGWDLVGGDVNDWVMSLAVYAGRLIAAGAFTEVGGVPISLIAQLNEVPTPVAISAFVARPNGAGVELAWEIAADEAFDGFHVYRGEVGGTDELVNSSILAPDVREYADNTAQPATRYSYFLVAVGTASGEVRSPRVEIELPTVTATLLQNAPNPFNPATTIRFVVPGNDHVSIDIYSPAGQRVRILVNTTFPPGTQSATWDGTDDNGQRVASGVYLYRMRIGRVEQSKKMVLLK